MEECTERLARPQNGKEKSVWLGKKRWGKWRICLKRLQEKGTLGVADTLTQAWPYSPPSAWSRWFLPFLEGDLILKGPLRGPAIRSFRGWNGDTKKVGLLGSEAHKPDRGPPQRAVAVREKGPVETPSRLLQRRPPPRDRAKAPEGGIS